MQTDFLDERFETHPGQWESFGGVGSPSIDCGISDLLDVSKVSVSRKGAGFGRGKRFPLRGHSRGPSNHGRDYRATGCTADTVHADSEDVARYDVSFNYH